MSLLKSTALDAVMTCQERLMTEHHRSLADRAQLYVITRRPRVRVQDLRVRRKKLCMTVRIDSSRERPESIAKYKLRKEFGQVFGVDDLGDEVVIQSEWAPIRASKYDLALFAAGFQSHVANHEVLYVGQGQAPNALQRLANHSKLQRIYADHQASGYDIFVTFLNFADVSTMLVMGNRGSIDVARNVDVASIVGRSLGFRDENTREGVALSEAALITYFQPPYNDRLRRFPQTQATIATQLRDRGYTQTVTTLDVSNSGIRLWSAQRKACQRAVPIVFDISPTGMQETTLQEARKELGATLDQIESECAHHDSLRPAFIAVPTGDPNQLRAFVWRCPVG